jgi:hypothetical protein
MQKIEIIIDGDNVKAVNAISGTETQLKKLDKKAKETSSIFNDVSKFINQHIGAITVGSAITGLGLLIKNAIDLGDKFYDMSQKTGIAVETLSVLDYAAKLNSTDIDTLSTLVAKFSKNIYEADQGSGKAVDGFKTLSIGIRDSHGKLKDVDSVLIEVTKKFKDMPDGIQKTALAQQLFGKAGAQSIPILNDLGTNFEKYKKQLQDVGGIISTDFANKADKLKDNLTTLNYAVKGVGISLAEDLLPSLTALSTVLVENATKTDGSVGLTNIFSIAIKSVATAALAAASGLIVYAEGVATYGAVVAKLVTLRPTDAWYAFKGGLEQMKKTSLDVGKIFDAMWNPEKYKAQYEALAKAMQQQEELALQTQKQQEAAKRKAEAFKKVTDEINFQISIFGLSEVDKRIAELVRKYRTYKKEFGDKPIFEKGFISERDMILAENYGQQMEKLWDKEKKIDEERKKAAEERDAWNNQRMDDWINRQEEQRKREEELEKLRVQIASNAFADMADAAYIFYQLSGEQSEAWFDTYKAFAIAETIVNTYASAEAAYKAMAGIPVVGPFLGAAAAAAAVAFGIAQVSRITSVGPSGGSVSSAVPSAVPTSQASASAVTNNNTSNQTTQTVVHKTLNINGDVLDVQAWLRKNRSAIQRFFDDGNIDLAFG